MVLGLGLGLGLELGSGLVPGAPGRHPNAKPFLFGANFVFFWCGWWFPVRVRVGVKIRIKIGVKIRII